jgi:hypothetical protein
VHHSLTEINKLMIPACGRQGLSSLKNKLFSNEKQDIKGNQPTGNTPKERDGHPLSSIFIELTPCGYGQLSGKLPYKIQERRTLGKNNHWYFDIF